MSNLGVARFLYVKEYDGKGVNIVPIAMLTVPTEEFFNKLSKALNIEIAKEANTDNG